MIRVSGIRAKNPSIIQEKILYEFAIDQYRCA